VPTYQYACKACGHRLEAVQSFTDEPLTECPACAGQLRKVFSSVGIVFKGSGFYRNDSRATPKKDLAGVSAGKESTGSAGTDAGTDKASSGSQPKPSGDTKPAAAA